MLSEALGIKSISKDQVSRICKELDTEVHAFRTRRLDGEFPYVFLDAAFEKVRENGRGDLNGGPDRGRSSLHR